MNLARRISNSLRAVLLTAAIIFSFPQPTLAAGVTVITHGQFGSIDDWVLGMAGHIPTRPNFAGTNVICYEIRIVDQGTSFTVTPAKLAGGNPLTEFSDEIVIKLDWSDLAGIFTQYDTYTVADLVVPKLLATNYISALGGHALAELPIHLIGHSRGGSVICEMSKLLGMQGIWVDQVTTLDPHPVNNSGNDDPLLVVTDAPLIIYRNVLFADNYYQDYGGYPHGQFVSGAYNRFLAYLMNGYIGIASEHSDTHLWYHGTVDLRDTAFDGAASLPSSERPKWYSNYELNGAKAGYYYSRLGRGDRLSNDDPAGGNSTHPVDGLNQIWDFGAGQAANRTGLPTNNGAWPNVIQFNLAGTNAITAGESNTVEVHYQWAQPTTSLATFSVFLDDDFNPYNGNEKLLRTGTVQGTGADGVSHFFVSFPTFVTNALPGDHALYARVSDGSHTRYLYAPEILQVSADPFAPPIIAENPVSQSIGVGASNTFSVTAFGAPPLLFQWRKDGATLDNATNSTLLVSNAAPNDTGDYNVVVANGNGAVTSTVAHLTIIVPPRVTLNGSSIIALKGSNTILTATIEGTQPLTYQWFFRNRRVAGATNAELTISKTTTKATGSYALEVRNAVGVARSVPVALRVVTAPAIRRQPKSISVLAGKHAKFHVTATGTHPFAYQWFKDGSLITNATKRTLTLSVINTNDAGMYSARVSNVGTNAESLPATLTVMP